MFENCSLNCVVLNEEQMNCSKNCSDELKQMKINSTSCLNELEQIDSDKLNCDLNSLKSMDQTNENSNGKQNLKRDDYLIWEDYFMSVALLSAKRSKGKEFLDHLNSIEFTHSFSELNLIY